LLRRHHTRRELRGSHAGRAVNRAAEQFDGEGGGEGAKGVRDQFVALSRGHVDSRVAEIDAVLVLRTEHAVDGRVGWLVHREGHVDAIGGHHLPRHEPWLDRIARHAHGDEGENADEGRDQGSDADPDADRASIKAVTGLHLGAELVPSER